MIEQLQPVIPLEAAREYVRRGWRVVPIPFKRKGATIDAWNQMALNEADLSTYFDQPANIGLILGEPSGWLVDVDLDCPEAIELAEQYLPPTPAVTGRPSKPRSHYWYYAPGAVTDKHADQVTNKMIVEFRSTGAQTVVGPSIHPDDREPYEILTAEPAKVSAPMLAACVEALAKRVIELRYGTLLAKPEPVRHPNATSRVQTSIDLERRALAYLAKLPPAISGQGGHPATYAAATALVHGFGLDPELALSLLLDHYNPRCEPPWSEKELRHKVEDAASKPHTRPHGWLRDQERELGLVIRTEDAVAAEKFGDTLDDLWKVIRSGIFAVGMAVVPLLQDWALAAIQVAKVTSDWVRNNQQLIVTVFKVLVGIVAVGAAIMSLGVLVYGTGAAFGIAASLITGVGAVLGTIGTVIAALLSPIGLVSVAIVGLAGYLLYASGLGAQALQWLGEEFQALKADALTAWQGIGDALAAGNLSLAAKILWLTLKMEWQKGVAFLEKHWATFKEAFLSIATDAFYGVVGLLVNAWSGLQSAWIETTAFLADAWMVFTSGLTKGWSTAQNFISKGVLRLMKLFDSSLDVEAASQILDQTFAAQNAANDQQRNQQIGQRDQRKQEQLAQIEHDRQAAQDEIDQMAADSHAARQQQNQDDLQASEEALRQARQEWEAAIADAATQRQQADANAPDRLRRAQQDLEGMDDLLSQIGHDKVSVKGTFNALGARGLGSEGPAERTAKATEETAINTKKLLAKAHSGAIVFS